MQERLAADPRSKPQATLPHLFLFIACCGLYLASARALDRQALESPTLFGLTLVAIHGLCTAAAWTALCMFIFRLVLGARWPIEPGFSLAAILGVRLALEVLLSLPERPVFHSTEAVLDGVTCLLLVCPLFGRLPVRWQVIFTCLLIMYGLPLLAMFVSGPREWIQRGDVGLWMQFGRLAIGLLLLFGLLLDNRQGKPTWLHKLGLALWILWTFYCLVVLLVMDLAGVL